MKKQVKDLWVNGQWCFDSTATLIPNDVKNHITCSPIRQSEADDGWIWHPKVDGNYYGWLLDRCGRRANELSWKWVWRFKALEKVKHLLWFYLHEALPTNMLWCHRGMSQNPRCMRCSGEQESILHCIRDCPHAREMWLRLGFLQDPSFLSIDIHQRLYAHAHRRNAVLFFLGLWWNWRWWNNMVLDTELWSIHMVMQNIHIFWFDLTHIFTISPVYQEVNEKWLPPSPGLVKLNVDELFGAMRVIVGVGTSL